MLTFIVNPAAGNQHALKVQNMLKQELERRGIESSFCLTEKPGHATDLAREAALNKACSGVIAVGGDGTAPKKKPVTTIKIGRNDPCPCGSGQKWKKCTCKEYHS